MMALVESCLNPIVLKHTGGSRISLSQVDESGHFIPNAADIRTEIVQFIQNRAGEYKEVNRESN
jgi:hypothetical protein